MIEKKVNFNICPLTPFHSLSLPKTNHNHNDNDNYKWSVVSG